MQGEIAAMMAVANISDTRPWPLYLQQRKRPQIFTAGSGGNPVSNTYSPAWDRSPSRIQGDPMREIPRPHEDNFLGAV